MRSHVYAGLITATLLFTVIGAFSSKAFAGIVAYGVIGVLASAIVGGTYLAILDMVRGVRWRE